LAAGWNTVIGSLVGRRQETVAVGAVVVVVCGPGGVLCEFGQGEVMDRFF